MTDSLSIVVHGFTSCVLYKNTKVNVRSPDGDTDYFDIVASVLQGDPLAPYLFIICLDLEKLRFILSDRSDFHLTDSLSIAVQVFARHVLMSFSVDETLLPR